MTRTELSECIAIAKSRFKNLFDVEVARGWADMDYKMVKEYLSNSIPETILLRGMSGEYIKKRHDEEVERERQNNYEHYGLYYTDEELCANEEEFIEAQKEKNYKIFGHRWTDDELILEHWYEVWKDVEDKEDKGS